MLVKNLSYALFSDLYNFYIADCSNKNIYKKDSI